MSENDPEDLSDLNDIWTTADGRRIRVQDMGNQHLINTIKMLIRKAEAYRNEALQYYPSFQGEMAQMYAEAEWQSLATCPVEELLPPIFEIMVEEAGKRGLKYD
jgi:hypothetical protein